MIRTFPTKLQIKIMDKKINLQIIKEIGSAKNLQNSWFKELLV